MLGWRCDAPQHEVPGCQYRRCALAARRSAAVRRLPARRRLLLDDAPFVVRNRARRCHRARSLRRARRLALPQGPPHRDRRRRQAANEYRRQRQHQSAAHRGHHYRHSRRGGMEAGNERRRVRHKARATERRTRRGTGADRNPLARAHAERTPRGQRIQLGADRGSRHPVCRHLHLYHSGASDARCRSRRRLRMALGRAHRA